MEPESLFNALRPFLCPLHVCAVGTAAWASTANRATELLSEPPGRAVQAAIRAGLRAARDAADCPLGSAFRAAITPQLRAVAVHVLERPGSDREPIEALAGNFVHVYGGGALVHACSQNFRAAADNTHDASVLGWPARVWPTEATFRLANGQSVNLARAAVAVDFIGDIAYVSYGDSTGVRVTVEND